MISKISQYLVLMLVFIQCSAPGNDSNNDSISGLIEVSSMNKILDSPDVKLIDFRPKEAYDQGHIAGAINMWRPNIESENYPYRGMMIEAEKLESFLSESGINPEDRLIVYDDNGSCDAIRFWWVMKNYSFDQVMILNGGLNAWKSAGRSISFETIELPVTEFKFNLKPNSNLSIDHQELLASMDMEDLLLFDTRSNDEFSGKRQKRGATLGGRINNSVQLDWVMNVNEVDNKRFQSIQFLDSVYSRYASSKDQPIVTYCHSGVRSSVTYYVLTEMLGYTNVRNYDGSWVEWSYFNLPFEKDSITSIIE